MASSPLDFRKPHVLRNRREFDAAVGEIDSLLDRNPRRASEEYERLEFLSVLVKAYEDEHDPIDETGTPQSVVAFMLEQTGRTRADRATHGWPRPCLRVLRRQAAAFDRADPQAIIDLDARAVERSTPDEPRPEILVDQLDWLPAGASEPLLGPRAVARLEVDRQTSECRQNIDA